MFSTLPLWLWGRKIVPGHQPFPQNGYCSKRELLNSIQWEKSVSWWFPRNLFCLLLLSFNYFSQWRAGSAAHIFKDWEIGTPRTEQDKERDKLTGEKRSNAISKKRTVSEVASWIFCHWLPKGWEIAGWNCPPPFFFLHIQCSLKVLLHTRQINDVPCQSWSPHVQRTLIIHNSVQSQLIRAQT